MVKLTEELVLARCRSKELASVRKINYWGTELDDISIMRKLVNVEVVSLSVNDITSLEDFQNCRNLQELYIRKNKISNLNEIYYLKKLPKLRTLWLADNPCATGTLYRMTVLKNLPNLNKLDNAVVETDELNVAIDQGADLVIPEGAEKFAEVQSEDSAENIGKVTTLGDSNELNANLECRPLPEEKVAVPSKSGDATKFRDENILHAVLTLVKELNAESLESVVKACQDQLQTL
ncbi:C21orf2 [Bugula neritina]|uniref:C21orf2 n=1 Tax=Bugula neritina TaxID=10212 RepID=A0A7J7J1Z9_BUGNE|nr:C21orf2 [Bugula neritina]